MKDFANRIRHIRQIKGYSQDYVSMKIGISLSAYSKIERGTTDPSLSRMLQIADVLEIDLGQIQVSALYGMPKSRDRVEEDAPTETTLAWMRTEIEKIRARLEQLENKLSQ
jgi:transcriptional regulator with XRE-family HTH domain